MTANHSNEVMDDIITFLKNERELYGDFTISDEQIHALTHEKEGQPATSIPPSSKSNPSKMKYFDPQKKLFNNDNDGSRKIYHKIANCNTLDKLENLCAQADVLKTDLADTSLVFGAGNSNSDLMLIGEAPGAEEDRQGKPFVGRAGKLLTKILAAIDFKRDDVYISNILKHRPPNNRNPKPEERQKSLPFLLRQIDLINPKLILCLGRVSANTLLDNNKSLGSMRQEFHPFREKYELMVTYHPAALLRNPNWKRPAWEDVQLLHKRYDELGGKP
jgi:DNA polymerase